MACGSRIGRAGAPAGPAPAPGTDPRHWKRGIGSLALLVFVACNFHLSSPPLAGQGGRRHPCVKHKVLD